VDIKAIIADGENLNTEFKTSFNADAIETLVAFANTSGGRVLVGVTDSKKIVGISLTAETTQNWINEIKNKTIPSLIPQCNIHLTDSKQVVEFYIGEYPIKPVAVKGRYYKRIGNSNHLLNNQEISDLHLQTFNTSWDNYPSTRHALKDISLEKVSQFVKLVNQIREIPITDAPGIVLNKLELINNSNISNACYLLFSNSSIQVAIVQAGRFSNSISIKDDTTIDCDLFGQVDAIMSFIKKHINKGIIVTESAQHIERWQYPLNAIREIVINMIVHRNYQDGGNSIIKIYDERIEFFNPGRLPDTISVEQLLSGEYISRARNKRIASLFKEAGLIEQYGSGIKRIIYAFNEYDLPTPTFENIQYGFRVTVFSKLNDVEENVTEKVPDRVTNRVTDRVTNRVTDNQAKLLMQMKANPMVSTNELATLLGISQRKVKENIKKLKDLNRLQRIGSEKAGHWKVMD
jgi:ATP-dependent DNA helicase RecG